MRLRQIFQEYAQRFLRDRRANALPMFAITALPMLYLTGMGIDYTLAAQRQAKLNALADAAALAAITPAMMAQSDAQAQTAAQDILNGQATKMAGINYDPKKLTVNVVDNGPQRTVSVSYQATSQNMFPGVLDLQTLSLTGKSQSTTTLPPNMDFYLLLDNSPSMAIAATSDGINTMVANTQAQGGCAFACHETAPSWKAAARDCRTRTRRARSTTPSTIISWRTTSASSPALPTCAPPRKTS